MAIGKKIGVAGVAGRNRITLRQATGRRVPGRGRYRLRLVAPGAKTATLRFAVRR